MYQSPNAQNIRSNEMKSLIYQNYNNDEISNGCYVSKT